MLSQPSQTSKTIASFEILTLQDLGKVAREIITLSEKLEQRIWILEGDLGAGKTTFTKAVCEGLGITQNVSSPTFALINQYENTETLVYHCDFYRIENPNEVLELGIEEYFEEAQVRNKKEISKVYCFLEWASKIEPFLPEEYLKLEFKVNLTTQSRLLTVYSL